jgi:hypothetical protein
MRYIRFLKPPKLQGTNAIALITITSDLGDSFYPQEALIAATIHSADLMEHFYVRQCFKWTPNMRSMSISLDLSGCDVNWPARLHITARNTPRSDYCDEYHIVMEQPGIVSAWSDIVDLPRGITEASRTVERRLTSLNGRTIGIWEETGESIARHIWYDCKFTRKSYILHDIGMRELCSLRNWIKWQP